MAGFRFRGALARWRRTFAGAARMLAREIGPRMTASSVGSSSPRSRARWPPSCGRLAVRWSRRAQADRPRQVLGRQLQGGCSELIDTPCCASLGAGPRQGNPRDKLCGRQPSTPEGRPRQPRTNTRECGSQPAYQSLLTVVSAALPPALRNSHTALSFAGLAEIARHAERC